MMLFDVIKDDLDRVIPDLRKRDHDEDEDPSAGSNKGKRKRSSRKFFEPSKTSSTSKETSKGDTLPKSSKPCISASTEESVKEASHKVTMGEEEHVQENVNNADQPQDLVGPVYNLLKGTCQSNIKLEYNMEECFEALTDRLDWENPKVDRCPFDLSKLFL
nr:hypothetical protein [Tanacetum cinerariifolium]